MQRVTSTKRAPLFSNKEPQLFSTAKTLQHLAPYQVKQEVKKPLASQNQSATAIRSGSNLFLNVPNPHQSVETASKIYRVSNREKLETDPGESKTDKKHQCEPPLRIEAGVEKPKPPSSITLKYNSALSGKSRRVTGNTSSKAAKRVKTKEKETSQGAAKVKKVFETDVPPTIVYKRQDVLSSLRKLSLIEPLLKAPENGFNSLPNCLTNGDSSTTIQKSPKQSDHSNANKATNIEKQFISGNTKQFLTTIQESLAHNQLGVSHDKSVKARNYNTRDVPSDVTEHDNPLSSFSSNTNDMLCRVANNVGSKPKDYFDTSDNESFIYRDSYNNKISVREELRPKLYHGTPIPIEASLNELSKSSSKRRMNLTQKQLSYVSSTVPTATVVDISSGSVVEANVEVEDKPTVLTDNVEHLQSLATSKTGVPSSFYYNRKIKRQKQEDQAEMLELNKLQEQSQKEIKNTFKGCASEYLREKPSKVPTKVKRVSEDKPIEYRIVQLLSPHQVEVETEVNPSTNSSDSEKGNFRCSSSLTQSSSTSSSKQPDVPNSSPQLAPNRFHIFPTGNPIAFHAYTGDTSKPTVIKVDHFSRAKASLSDQQERKTETNLSKSNRKSTNGLACRFTANTDAKLPKQNGFLNMDTLIKGESISLKNQFQSDVGFASDCNDGTSDESVVKSSSEDEKKIGHSLPPHTAPKIFKFSNSGANKVKRPKENKEPVVYQPLQSLVIKSCQSVDSVLVIPTSGQTAAGRESFSALPFRTKKANGHISPLNGIRILRQKITMKHYDKNKYPCFENAGIRYFNKNPQTVSQCVNSAKEKDNHITSNSSEESCSKQPLDTLSHLQKRSTKCVNVDGTTFSFNKEKVNELQELSDLEDFGKGQFSDSDFVDKSINIYGLNLGHEKSKPLLLLKEGSMQSLNFFNLNSVQFSNRFLATQDVKNACERSSRKRRKIQLGANETADDFVNVKIAAGGGFKSNVSRYSLLLRQKYHKQHDKAIPKSLQREEILEISKAEIGPLIKNDKRACNSSIRPSTDENAQLPAIKDATIEAKADNTVAASNLISKSRLQIRDLLENLCSDEKESENEKSEKSGRLSRSAADCQSNPEDKDGEEHKRYEGLNKTPSLNDITGSLPG